MASHRREQVRRRLTPPCLYPPLELPGRIFRVEPELSRIVRERVFVLLSGHTLSTSSPVWDRGSHLPDLFFREVTTLRPPPHQGSEARPLQLPGLRRAGRPTCQPGHFVPVQVSPARELGQDVGEFSNHGARGRPRVNLSPAPRPHRHSAP